MDQNVQAFIDCCQAIQSGINFNVAHSKLLELKQEKLLCLEICITALTMFVNEQLSVSSSNSNTIGSVVFTASNLLISILCEVSVVEVPQLADKIIPILEVCYCCIHNNIYCYTYTNYYSYSCSKSNSYSESYSYS